MDELQLFYLIYLYFYLFTLSSDTVGIIYFMFDIISYIASTIFFVKTAKCMLY